nr:uncharacterized protein LOC113803369 [Penaeus vannamei]
MTLDGGGTFLVIHDVQPEDEAEYRCRVHFRLSPTWTQRLLLVVEEEVDGIEMEDGSGRAVGGRVGPLEEGANLTLTCQGFHGASKVVSFSWFLDGEELDTSWASAGEGVVVNQLKVAGVEQRHRDARVTCRLVTVDEGQADQLAANITDRTAVIAMFYVPDARIVAEGGRATGGGGRELKEGDGVTLLCSVHADPPVYNITWLHNGRVVGVGGRRWMRDNASLVVSPVDREDAGLYTCLASNREGDGHSNAVHVRVLHPPYCEGPAHRHRFVAINTSVTLRCQVEANPTDVTFTWKIGISTPQSQPEGGGNAAPATVQHPPGDPPSEAVPVSSFLPPAESWEPSQHYVWEVQSDEGSAASEVEHDVDAEHPDRSSVTLTPAASTVVGCYAKNRVGHIRVPCTYTITVVEPPRPLHDCGVTMVGVTRMVVKCEDPIHAHDDSAHNGQVEHSPSLSFVRSPEASTKANLEVWSEGILLVNMSDSRPVFNLHGLPPSANLSLVLYTATPHARSSPLYLDARTLPRPVFYAPAPPPTHPPPEPGPETEWAHDGLGWKMGAAVGGVGVVVLVLVAAGMRAWARRRAAATPSADGSLTPSQDQILHEPSIETQALEESLSDIPGLLSCESTTSTHTTPTHLNLHERFPQMRPYEDTMVGGPWFEVK